MDETTDEIYRCNHRLKRNCTLVLAALLLATTFANSAATGFGDVGRIAEGTSFEDYGSFKAFMEQDVPAQENGDATSDSIAAPSPDGSMTYYDPDGNVISEEEANTRTIEDADGNVRCTFVHRNQSVVSWRYGHINGELLPITVFTQSQFQAARQKAEVLHAAFVLVSLSETAAVLLFYVRKRAK